MQGWKFQARRLLRATVMKQAQAGPGLGTQLLLHHLLNKLMLPPDLPAAYMPQAQCL